ncbi:DUF979 domain-containing protein [Falsarthrobacter nasiphocae]|uniref:Membrane protein n=1 Tax=Falsarthrobacter nasiphocae TaxID=189863 RepID=A0AAE3YIX3_9MICC|nr:DUF979 domain-containing protein [Falsarthrobacter nasiphocae]MDR6892813.1 putative membrane protein [Falsarthrobacter nasiphocae]
MSEWIYWIAGAFFATVGIQIARDPAHSKRWTNAAFWILLGACFFYGGFIPGKTGASALGPKLPAAPLGAMVIALALIAGLGLTSRGDVLTTTEGERESFARRYGSRLFIPALTVPVVTVIIAAGISKIPVNGKPMFATGTETIQGLTIGCLVALLVAVVMFRVKSPAVPLHEGRRLLESIGWAVLLPQMLSTLGTLFTNAGVGTIVGEFTRSITPEGNRIVAVLIYALGMFVFTAIMGNAFAAFPIMTAAIGWPVLVEAYGASPAPLFAVAMLAGFSGTLVTPMAANFNIVPAALLEMKNQYGPIKAQIPTALIMLAVNIVFMCVFPWL